MPSLEKQFVSPPTNNKLSNNKSRSAWEFNQGLKVLIYGGSGTGKTTLASTFPGKTLWLVCSGGKQPGELRSIDTPENRKRIDARIVTSTEEMKSCLKDISGFDNVVQDHISGLQDVVLKDILGLDDLPEQKGWGLAKMQEWGQCAAMCKDLVKALLSHTGNVVILGQEKIFSGKDEGTSSEIIMPSVGCDVIPSFIRWLNPAMDYVIQTFKRPKMKSKEITMADGKKMQAAPVRVPGVEYCARIGPHDVFTTKFRVIKERSLKLPDIIVDPSCAKIKAIIAGEAVK